MLYGLSSVQWTGTENSHSMKSQTSSSTTTPWPVCLYKRTMSMQNLTLLGKYEDSFYFKP